MLINLLLWAAFFLGGGKTPEAFFVWGAVALVVCASRLHRVLERVSWRGYWKEAVLVVCLLASQVFAQDPSVTLYGTTQALVFIALWVTLKADPSLLPEPSRLVGHLLAMGGIAFVVTAWQALRGPWNAINGLFPINPIFNATWMAGIATMAIAYGVAVKKSRVWIVGVVLAVACIALPARSSVLALGIGILYALHRHLTLRRIAWVLAGVTVLAVAIPSRLISKRLRLNEGNYRTQLWAVAAKAAADHPWVGRGLGNFEMGYQRHAFPVDLDPVRYSRTTAFAHNEFLQVAADVGFPACLLLMYGIVLLFLIPATTPATRTAKAVLLVMATLAFYNIIWHLPILLLLTVIWSAVLRRSTPVAHGARHVSPETRYGAGGGLALLVVILGGLAVREHLARQDRWMAIVTLQPYDATAWKNAADRQPTLGEALPGYAHAVQWVPHQIYFREAFARALEASRQPEALRQAVVQYTAALSLAPHRAVDALALGRLSLLGGEPQKALSYFEAARRMEPRYWECDLWAARCLALLGRWETAVAALDHLRKRRADYFAWRQRVAADLPSSDDSSDYDRVILRYDDAVVMAERAAILGSSGRTSRYRSPR